MSHGHGTRKGRLSIIAAVVLAARKLKLAAAFPRSIGFARILVRDSELWGNLRISPGACSGKLLAIFVVFACKTKTCCSVFGWKFFCEGYWVGITIP